MIHESGTFEHLPNTSPSYGKKCYATLICLFLSVKEKLISLKAFFVFPSPPLPCLLCRMMDVALQIMSSPLSLIHWETLSQLHVHCSLSFSLVFSFLSASLICFLFLSLLHISSRLCLMIDVASSASAIRGALGPVMPEDPEDSGQAKPSERAAH